MIRVMIVDDHDLVREGLRALLAADDGIDVVGEAGGGREAIERAGRLRPDVVLMDISLPGGLSGFEAAQAILADRPETRVVMLTQHRDREYVRRALQIGVHGYLPKSSVSSQLVEAIRSVHGGHRYLHPTAAEGLVDLVISGESLEHDDYDRLSPRERQVLQLLAEGKTSREIARYLEISIKTAMTHRANLMGKLDLHSRVELIKYAIRKKLIEL